MSFVGEIPAVGRRFQMTEAKCEGDFSSKTSVVGPPIWFGAKGMGSDWGIVRDWGIVEDELLELCEELKKEVSAGLLLGGPRMSFFRFWFLDDDGERGSSSSSFRTPIVRDPNMVSSGRCWGGREVEKKFEWKQNRGE